MSVLNEKRKEQFYQYFIFHIRMTIKSKKKLKKNPIKITFASKIIIRLVNENIRNEIC